MAESRGLEPLYQIDGKRLSKPLQYQLCLTLQLKGLRTFVRTVYFGSTARLASLAAKCLWEQITLALWKTITHLF